MTDLAERRGVETTVYQPAEDSELLASVAREAVGPGDVALDVGTGSGYVAAEMEAAEPAARVVGVDRNPHACGQARDHGVEAVRGNLTAPFRAAAFDLVVFNPPYLPTPREAERDDWMERALSGGESGREVVEPFLADVGRVLAPGGTCLLLVSSLTDVEAVRGLAADAGLSVTEAASEKFPFERLVVLELELL
ncbi:MAG: HemK2/MTQ2 family protein methyltransferase [Haloarculaceae archaeon]